MANYPLPRDTVAALAGARVSNLGLYLDKFIEIDTTTYKATERAKSYTDAPTALFNAAEGKALLAACAVRHRQMLAAAHALVHTASPQNRCIVGLGTKGMLEVGIRLHHLYGYPIIPGSALKGVARANALSQIFTQLSANSVRITTEHDRGVLTQLEHDIENYDHKADKRAKYLDTSYSNESSDLRHFLAIFGRQDGAGAAVFFDAVPEQVSFEVDIMNVHYPDYYNAKGKNTPPADYYSPTPIDFLTVGKSSRFIFGVAVRHPRFSDLREQAWNWLKLGLETMGIGAKTTSGYGLFTGFQQGLLCASNLR